ncbi:hypothetical protein [Paraburkholderia tuberum]|uniref:Uncharacterized protein n=1 Tax=Paraburkholderia tuberum TaxID=157910 RepID=A0A1H1GWP2_9BURK|nr:hypothetical protein [Paraburkholderia tuberum]SDR17632.1 hypothetical protein SAMN05445850_3130 [Paraburkholderia tuberum]
MNLHGIVSPIIAAVNPMTDATLRRSAGYDTGPDLRQVPKYADTGVTAQVQALTAMELQHIAGLNLQGVLRAAYLYGNVQGVVQGDKKGGDLVLFADDDGVRADLRGTTWLVVQVLETWPDWCKVVLCQQ